ncbi:AsnC family protein [Acidianus manzaensis]|uniref:AsnC family protein n=1 Tax=Acidianus manzaensis TaxID=282676 RepID=A0A1W6K388_9CREN|nr:AsnC family protein [Acidianus manzaensis]ARM76976.1 hypothetical protein B6F84_13745 [Acidianus manzaensis]
MQLLSQKNKLSTLLYYIQRFGDLNPKILGLLSGIKDAEELISYLRNNYEYRTFPFFNEKALGLDKYIFTIYSRRKFDLLKLYEMFDGMIGFALRDVFNPSSINLMIYSNSLSFFKIFDYLLDNDFIYHYEYLGKVKSRLIYPLDYSMFNFETKEFEGISPREREPFQNVDLTDDFKPDYYDVRIIGKKQERTYSNLKDLSSLLGFSFKDVLYHYQKHIAGKGLISSYTTFVVRPHYRLQVIFSKENTLRYLTRIPTLYYVHILDNYYVAHILGWNSQLFKYVDFIKDAEYEFNDKISITVHPANDKYRIAASIPYEHFTEDGKWDFNVERMILKAERVIESINYQR